MKTCRGLLGSIFTVVFTTGPVHSQDLLRVEPPNGPPLTVTYSARTPWEAKPRDAFETEWTSIQYVTNRLSGKVRAHTNSYFQIGNGLNVQDPQDGAWRAASASFEITERGAEARQSGHRVLLHPNINSRGAVTVERKDTTLQGHPLCLGYYDPTDGRSVLLSSLRDSIGLLVSSNVVIYTNCFEDISASVRYRNHLHGVSQDVILHEAPPPPEAFGLSPDSRLELFTEWLSDVPQPVSRSRVIESETDPAKRASSVEPDFHDEQLIFNGALRMGLGRAFLEAASTNEMERVLRMDSVFVGKRFLVIDGRPVLIEAVPHRHLRSVLQKMRVAPIPGAILNTNASLFRSKARVLTARHLPSSPGLKTTTNRVQVADASSPEKLFAFMSGLTLDYELLENEWRENFEFESGVTYLIEGGAFLTGVTRIGAGVVVKYGPGASLEIEGSIDCRTEPHRPAIFCAKDADSIGEDLFPYSNHIPSGRYASPALRIDGITTSLKHLRFLDAERGIEFWEVFGPAMVTLEHCQMVRTDIPLYSWRGDFSLRNVLIEDALTLFQTDGTVAGGVEHLTARDSTYLAYANSGSALTLNLTNSLATLMGAPGGSGSVQVVENSTYRSTVDEPQLFQPSIFGKFYLAQNSEHRNEGTVYIDVNLLAQLRECSTYPAERITGPIFNSATYGRRPIRDDDGLPDRGYHYPAVDWMVSGVDLRSGALTFTEGTVVGMEFSQADYGISLQGGEFLASGGPIQPVRFLRLNNVQEQSPAAPAWNTLFNDAALGSAQPKARFRFAEFPTVSAQMFSFHGGNYLDVFEVTHSKFLGGYITASFYGLLNRTVAWTNNVFERVTTSLIAGQALNVFVYNNLFKRGSLAFSGGSFVWQLRDNVFDTLDLSCAGPIGSGNNGYSATTQLQDSGPNYDLTNPNYQTGALGDYYLPDTRIVDRGVRTVNQAQLAHFTTRPDQSIDISQVDLGFHYPAINTATGLPVDSDNDGLSNLAEDSNSNNQVDPGETDPNNPCFDKLDVVLVMDVSGSLSAESFRDEKLSAEIFVSKLRMPGLASPSLDRVGIVKFCGFWQSVYTPPAIKANLGAPASEVLPNIHALETCFGTQFHQPLAMAHQMLMANPNPGAQRVIVLMTDGQVYPDDFHYESLAVWAADDAKGDGIRIFTLGFDDGIKETFLKKIASSPDDFEATTSSSGLNSLLTGVLATVCRKNGKPFVEAGLDQTITLPATALS